MFLCYVFISSTVPPPTVTISPFGPIQGAIVGDILTLGCLVSTVSGVESSSVMISWMGPGGDTITNDSRMIISPTSSSGNNYTNSIQFTYLMEGDNGTYMCNVSILSTSGLASVELETLNSKFIDNSICIDLVRLMTFFLWFFFTRYKIYASFYMECTKEIHFSNSVTLHYIFN